MSDVNKEALRRWKSARRKAFRELVIKAGKGEEPEPVNAPDCEIEPEPEPEPEPAPAPVPLVEELVPVVEKLAVHGELDRLQKLVASAELGEPAVYFRQAMVARPGNDLGSLAVYEDYKGWCDEMGYGVMDYVDFAKGLAALMVGEYGAGSIDVDISTMGHGQQVNYRGIALRRSLRLVAAG